MTPESFAKTTPNNAEDFLENNENSDIDFSAADETGMIDILSEVDYKINSPAEQTYEQIGASQYADVETEPSITSPEPQADVYIEQLLETIDSDELSRFLCEQLRPAGFDEEELRYRFHFPEDTTVLQEHPHVVAWADGEKINFEPANFFNDVYAFQTHIEQKIAPGNYHDREVRLYEAAKIQLLHVFIHEQLHHLTFTNYVVAEKRGPDEIQRVYTRQTGIEKQVAKEAVSLIDTSGGVDGSVRSESREFFRGLNEGLTELMAQELTTEYMRQYPITDDQDIARESSSFWAESEVYKEERYMVEQLATVFAEMTEVPYDIMLKSFYHEYITNGHLLPPEFKNVIAEYLPDSIDNENLEASIASLTRSMTAESFEKDGDLNQKLQRLVSFLPEDKATHCQQTLAEIKQKYYPDRSSTQ